LANCGGGPSKGKTMGEVTVGAEGSASIQGDNSGGGVSDDRNKETAKGGAAGGGPI